MTKTIAIIGASADRAKFGNKAVRAFLQQGYTVYPVNPKETRIEGLPFARYDAGLLPPGVAVGPEGSPSRHRRTVSASFSSV